MAGLLAAWRGALVRAARRRAPLAAALALVLTPLPAHAQWPLGNFFRRSSDARVVSTTPHPAIARITVQEKNAVSFGSGSLIDARGTYGLVITNWHVVRDATGEINVEFPGGFRSPARLLKFDADWDLAALEIARPPLVPLPIAASLPQKGQQLIIAGYGSGNFRSAAGVCEQYLAPKDGMPFEMVEVSVEARQGDSGGPILNERGEIAGVLFGAGNGFTAGSYGGRVLDFLASVVPGGRPGSDQPGGMQLTSPQFAHSQPPAMNPTSEHVPQHDPFAADAPHVEDQLRAMAQPPAIAGQVPRNLLSPPARSLAPPGEPPAEVALVPLPSRRLAPPAGEAPVEEQPAAPSRIEVAQDSITPLSPAELTLSDGEITPALGPPLARSLSPRKGAAETKATSISEAPADQLLLAAWKQIGGSTLVEQVKTILAAFGVLGLIVVSWRLFSRDDGLHEAE